MSTEKASDLMFSDLCAEIERDGWDPTQTTGGFKEQERVFHLQMDAVREEMLKRQREKMDSEMHRYNQYGPSTPGTTPARTFFRCKKCEWVVDSTIARDSFTDLTTTCPWCGGGMEER